MRKSLICIVCPQGCHLTVKKNKELITVTGNKCKRGVDYGFREITEPKRVITSTVRVEGGNIERLSVKTDEPILKELIFDTMDEINRVSVHKPIKTGDVIIENVLGTGADVIATRTI